MPLISFAASRIRDFSALEAEGRAAIQSISDRTDELIETIEDHRQASASLLEEVRKVSAEQGVSQQASYFAQESEKHDELALRWRKYTIWTAAGLGLYALATTFAHKWVWLAPTNNLETVQLAISKVLIFGVIAYMLILCARNFLSHTHNAIINKQRQNALMTFTALVDAARDEDSKDVVLSHAAACIFAPQDTGYAKQTVSHAGASGPSVLGVLQTLRSVKSASKSVSLKLFAVFDGGVPPVVRLGRPLAHIAPGR